MDAKELEKANELVKKAKDQTKDLKSEADIKKFLADNKKDILEVAKKLKGDEQQQFKDVVNALNEFSSDVKTEAKATISGSKLICGLAATVAFFCSLNTIGFVLAAPIYAPLLQFAVKKLTGIKEAEGKENVNEARSTPMIVNDVLEDISQWVKDDEEWKKAKFVINAPDGKTYDVTYSGTTEDVAGGAYFLECGKEIKLTKKNLS